MKRASDAEIARMQELWRAGRDILDIEVECDRSENTIRRYCRGIQRPERPRGRGKKLNDQLIMRLRDRDKLSLDQIAKRFGVTPPAIFYALKRAALAEAKKAAAAEAEVAQLKASQTFAYIQSVRERNRYLETEMEEVRKARLQEGEALRSRLKDVQARMMRFCPYFGQSSCGRKFCCCAEICGGDA